MATLVNCLGNKTPIMKRISTLKFKMNCLPKQRFAACPLPPGIPPSIDELALNNKLISMNMHRHLMKE